MVTTSAAFFELRSPLTDEILATYPICTHIEVGEMVAAAEIAGRRWSSLDGSMRRHSLLAWARILADRIEEGAQIISQETGKPRSDAILEINLAIGHLAWAARNAAEVLRSQHRKAGALMANMSAIVERSPYGVIGVIGPWNYPLYTPMGSISYALAAGNAVIFKPSEFTPGVAHWLSNTFAEVAPHPEIFQVVTGLAQTGQALCESAVDKIAFTGSTKTAKLIATSCANSIKPVVLECGGKDPVIIDRDGDIKRAAEFTLWAAFSNAGQTCIGAERVYVHEGVADQFIALMIEGGKKIKSAPPGEGNYGPITIASQIGTIKSHIAAAIASGGQVVLGGMESIRGRYVDPVILINVPENSLAMQEESFGPIIIINRVSTISEAIALANSSSYGLGASIWSKRNGRKIASQLECGMVAINSIISFAAVASIPFGGVKNSGYGRIHGAEGLMEFTYARSIVRARFQLPLAFTSFERSNFADRFISTLVKILHGRSAR